MPSTYPEIAMEPRGRIAQFFHRTDRLLHKGGQVVVDAAKITPGLGLATCAVVGTYHFGHSLHDLFVRGDKHEWLVQSLESSWYGINTLPGVHHTLRIGHVVILGYDVVTWIRRQRGAENARYLLMGVGEFVAGLVTREAEATEPAFATG
jgi:hypothetical protein